MFLSLIVFSMFFFVFLITFGPHHFWPRPPLGPLSHQTVLCPKPMRIILENLGGAALRTICCSCFDFWAMGTLLAQDLCGISRCGVGVSLLCVFKIFVGASRNWRSPDSPPPDRPKFRFFPSPQFSFFLSCVFSLNFGGVI